MTDEEIHERVLLANERATGRKRRVPGWLAVEEFEFSRPRGVSIRKAVEFVAPDLGMTPQALERAYYRDRRVDAQL